MENYNLKSRLTGVLLLVYTLLVILTLGLSLSGGQLPAGASLVSPLLGISCLFVILLFIILSMFNSFKSVIRTLEKEKVKAEQERDDVTTSHENIIEKRTLEISVINASLNREIAERIQAETSALELKKQMELILNSAGEGIFGLDIDGTVTFANTSALIMSGYQQDELIGKSHHQLVHHSHADGTPHREEDCPIRQAYEDGIVHSCSEDVFWTREGSSFPVEYMSTPIIENSVIRGAVVVFRDTSTFK
ncbi:MAG: PAS domain-containing protein [Desulfocapsaceae bacterium]|jgi:PAS domain S-box-containing protein|nr:PAS domain-containing protein [Desulfocapsaceae bacterium]